MMPDLSVTIDDQKGICQYSSYMMKMAQYKNDLDRLNKSVENLKDAERDLEMVLDEDEPVRHTFGSGTVEVTFEEAKEMVVKGLKNAIAEVAEVEAAKKELQVKMEGLKRTLTGKFGDAIRLD